MSLVYKKKDNIVSRSIAGEFMLIPIAKRLEQIQSIFVLNPVAEYIWDQINGKKTLSQIIASICDNFSVAKQEAENDINDFIPQLINTNLIEESKAE